MAKSVKWGMSGAVFFILVVLVIYFAPSWSSTTRTGNSSLALTLVQISQLEEEVQKGDSQAAMRLSDYYLFFRKDPKNGLLFREEAAILGGDKGKVWVKGFIKLYGLDAYRETINRTNLAREKQLMSVIEKPE